MHIPNLVFSTLLILGSVLFCFTQSAWATKPCNAPCIINGIFNINECTKSSSWIAIGTISEIVHDRQGPPLNKDFARFKFNITSWEKGGDKQIKNLNFKVGWCQNYYELPKDTSGIFRVYGTGQPEESQSYYLYIEPIK